MLGIWPLPWGVLVPNAGLAHTQQLGEGGVRAGCILPTHLSLGFLEVQIPLWPFCLSNQTCSFT